MSRKYHHKINNQRDASDIPNRPTDVNRIDFRDPRPLTEIRRLLNNRQENINKPVDVRFDKRTFNPVERPTRIINSIVNYNRHPISQIKRNIKQWHQRQRQLAGQPISRDIYSGRDWLEHPRETWVCAKRKIRREVIFALNNKRGGRGGGGFRRRYNQDSLIRCRR